MSLGPIEHAARSAARAWRRARVSAGALSGGKLALLGMSAHAAVLELGGGLRPDQLPSLLPWLLLVPAGALLAARRAPAALEAARELDLRAGLAERLGTALHCADEADGMALRQRQDAAARAGAVDPAAWFRVPWARHLGQLAGLLVLLLFGLGLALTFELGPRPAPAAPEDADEDDLLAAIDREREALVELGDKQAVRLLNDLEQAIRRIRAREDELDRVRARRRPPPPPEEAIPEPELEPPPALDDQRPKMDGLTVEDLERLEAETLEQLRLTEGMEQELVADLFAQTHSAKKAMDALAHHSHHEAEEAHEAELASELFSDLRDGVERAVDNLLNEDLFNDAMVSEAAQGAPTDNLAKSNMDLISRDLSDEAQAAHDGAHDMQHKFNEFLESFVKDMQGVAADAALGRKKKKEGREVKTAGPQGVADKRDAMAEAGFQEMDAQKRYDAEPPQEPPAGAAPGDGPPRGEGQGPPPEGAELQATGKPGGDAIAMKGGGGGRTEAGATGAGRGDAAQDGGLRALIPPPGSTAGPLEEVLGQISQGRMDPEQREQVFDRLARHKVQAGTPSEADDVLIDYFAEAEALMADHRDALPPLFRDYAHSYFLAIRPRAKDEGRAETRR